MRIISMRGEHDLLIWRGQKTSTLRSTNYVYPIGELLETTGRNIIQITDRELLWIDASGVFLADVPDRNQQYSEAELKALAQTEGYTRFSEIIEGLDKWHHLPKYLWRYRFKIVKDIR